MKREFAGNIDARIPFAYVALVILMLSVGATSFMLGQDEKHGQEMIREASDITADYQDLSALDLETRAYYIMHDVMKERMDVEPDNDTKELDIIDDIVEKRLEEYINDTYPMTEGIFNIGVTDWDIHVILDEMNTTDLLLSTETTECGRTYVMDNSSLRELDTMAPPRMFATSRAVYFRLVGFAKYRIHNTDDDITIEKYSSFHKNVYSPLPLMKNLATRFQCDSSGEFSSMGKMIRYMVTTLAQYRVLCGYAGGGYGGADDEPGITDIVTEDDVELAVNLALLLAQARYFRDFDGEAAAAQPSSDNEFHDVEKLMNNYVNNGSIDPADLIALYNDLGNQSIDIGRIFAQSIYSFADRFVWNILELFWGEEWDPQDDGSWDNDMYFDPVLRNPIVDWDEIEGKGDTEEWCRERLMRWLEVFGKWLGLTDTGDENGEIVKIDAQAEEGALIKDIYSRYVHPSTPHTASGIPPAEPTPASPIPSSVPVLWNPTDYYLTGSNAYHVDGHYYLFGDAGDSTFSDKRWYVRSYIRPEESGQGESTDARYLILGEMPGVEGEDGRPHTYKIVTRDDWGSGVPEKTYEYYLVGESLIEKHEDYHESGISYYNTLRFITDTLARSMKQQPTDMENVDSKGMVDYAAYDTESYFDDSESGLLIHPNDETIILDDGLHDIVREEDGAVDDAIIDFSDYADQEKENWFKEGAYLNHTDDPDNTGEYFLYDLVKETVDLWYEMAVNLYDGGYREFDEDGDSVYDSDNGPEHWNNYEDGLNSELPVERYQTGKHETESGSEKLAGSFKFRNDALRDCYYRVMQTVTPRTQSFNFMYWEDKASSMFEWQMVVPPTPESPALYAWVGPILTGNAAVPMQDQGIIPMEVYDGSGTVEDYTPLDDDWKDPFDTYAEHIWDILKNGNSGNDHPANSQQGSGIETQIGNTVGDSEWPETTNEGLLDDITKEFIEDTGGLDQITDDGTYGSSGGSYDFSSDFYDFVLQRIALRYIDDNALWDKLSDEEGWLDRIISTEMTDRTGDNLDVLNVPYLTATRLHVPWEFWHGDRRRAAENGSLFTEELVVNQVPNRLQSGGDELDIEIVIPENGTHFVDAQDLGFPMSNDCFSTIWWINVTGTVQYKVRNSRLASVRSGEHDYFWYNFSSDLDIDFPVPIYSGWDLESDWRTGEIDYRMTRDYFGKVEEDMPEEPFFASKALVETVDATRDSADWMLDTSTQTYSHVMDSPMMGTKEKSYSITELTDCMIRAVDPRDDEEGLLEEAASDQDYINNISDNAAELENLGMSEIRMNYFGYPSVYYVTNTTLDMTRGALDEIDNATAFSYEMIFDAGMEFSGKDRIARRLFYETNIGGNPDVFSILGEMSLYNERPDGPVHNISIDTGEYLADVYSVQGEIEHLYLPLLDVNATVGIGIISSVEIPDELKSIIRDTERFGLGEHRNSELVGQTERYIDHFFGELYNDHIDTFRGGDLFGICVNVTGTRGLNDNYMNRSYGIDLSEITVDESEKVLRFFIKHLINNSQLILHSLVEPSVSPSIFMKVPQDIEAYLMHSVYHWEAEGDIRWEGRMAHTMTSVPYMGSPWDMGARTFTGGKMYPGGSDRYLLRFEMDMGG